MAAFSIAALAAVPVAARAQARSAACGPSAAAACRPTSRLPPVPLVTGSLDLRVAYPPSGALLTARDSTFVFGRTGDGRATLAINGHEVSVARDGAWLAWLPLPDDSVAVYHIVARLGADSAVLDHRVRLPRRFVPPGPGAWIDGASLEPRGARWAEPGELIRVAARAAPGASVWLRLPGGALVPLAPDTGSTTPVGDPFDRGAPRAAPREVGRYAGVFAARPLGAPLPAVTTPRLAPAGSDTMGAEVIAVLGADTARAPLPLRLAVLDPARRAVVVLSDDPARPGGARGVVVGRPTPGGTFGWFFRDGTVAAVSGRVNDELRVQLTRASVAWVSLADVAGTLPAGTPPPASRVGLVRLAPADSAVTARLALSARLPYLVDESDEALTVHLYGARSDLDWMQYGGTDPLVRRMRWAQPAEDEATITFELSRPVFGYRVDWRGSDLMLTIRRPPAVNRAHPLRGRIVAVDPGHPPLGAIGPTGLREAEANLAVALALRRLLERAGARVVLTRDADSAVGLYERTTMAERAGADVLVSIHNNAFPDGVNPFTNNGTSAYYFQPRAARLAFLVEDAMVRRMGLPNLGIGRGDLALVRPTWMPAVLCEGAFLMIPEQENALRTPSFQERYARGVLEGLEAWLRELAAR